VINFSNTGGAEEDYSLKSIKCSVEKLITQAHKTLKEYGIKNKNRYRKKRYN
jgi:hypothetical protein